MNKIANLAKNIATSSWFNNFILTVIFISATLVGLDTYEGIKERWGKLFSLIDKIVLAIFWMEVAIRVLAEDKKPWRYLADGWNVFDFTIVVLCSVPMGSDSTKVLRLFRILRSLRALRIIRKFENLRILVVGIIRSISGMAYVAGFLFLLMYILAVVGCASFAECCPDKFGNLGKALLTIFQMSIVDNWSDIMNSLRGHYPVGGVVYSISCVVLLTFMGLNFVVGVVMNAFSKEENKVTELLQKVNLLLERMERIEKKIDKENP